MSRLLCLLALLLAACGGGGESAPREHAQAVEGTFSRASVAYVQDFEGVWIPLDVDEPGYPGMRRVKNLYLNSGDATKWKFLAVSNASFTALGGVGTITHQAGQNGSPYFYSYTGRNSDPGDQPPSYFASRLSFRITSGSCTEKFSFVGRSNGTAIGSESNNPSLQVRDCDWRTVSQTAEQFELHTGYIQTLLTSGTTARSYELADIQFEDRSGAKNPISQEYCESTDKPGVCWFDGPPTTARTGALHDGFTASNGFVMGGGVLSQSLQALLSALPVPMQLEPEATNLALWSTNDHVGTAVVDSSSNNHPQPAPGLSCTSYVLTDPRSGRFVYSRNDLTFSGSTITSVSTDLGYFRPGNTVWLHLAGVGSTEAMRVLASSPRSITLDSALPLIAKGQKVNIHRVPAAGDAIMVRRNDGQMHYSTVADVTLPSIGAAAVDGYQHHSLVVALEDPFPCDGINSGRVGNENQPVYYYSPADLGVTWAHGAGAARLVYEREQTRMAGLGYLLRHGLVLRIDAGDTYAMVDLPGAFMPKGVEMTASAWVKSSNPAASLSLAAHAGGVSIPADYTRVASTAISRNNDGRVRLVVPAGASVFVAVPQLESLPYMSSPIVTGAVPATRAATVIDTGSN